MYIKVVRLVSKFIYLTIQKSEQSRIKQDKQNFNECFFFLYEISWAIQKAQWVRVLPMTELDCFSSYPCVQFLKTNL